MSIHVLDNNLINKIAAGEVVERPASVVKELVENSIDAGATSITVEVKGGGIDLIKITDNGRGIPKEEVASAFLRHATSKLNTIEDLESILTLGFRGEALSSIAAVSQVEMVTKTADETVGTRFCINGGVPDEQTEAAANTGTVFTVKNIFYNTPARRKFLKKPSTEGIYVSETINRIAMGHPHISIKYINNGSNILYTSGNNDLKEVVMRIYGRDVASQMLEVSSSRNGYNINGMIAKPTVSRANRNYENFFINGRYIRSTIVQDAVQDACKGRLMVGKFPVFVLNLSVPYNTVDVNVHPTKLEVRFSDEGFIYDFIYEAIEKVLRNTNLIVEEQWGKKEKEESKQSFSCFNAERKAENTTDDTVYNYSSLDKKIFKVNEFDFNNENTEVENKSRSSFGNTKEFSNIKRESGFKNNEELSKARSNIMSIIANEGGSKGNDNSIARSEKSKAKNSSLFNKNEPFFSHYRIIGQVFGTYWLVEQENSLYMIDQHAAHERSIYEELKEKMLAKEPVSQMMLQPVVLSLTEGQKLVLKENRKILEDFGFLIENLGEETFALKAVPYVFDSPGNAGFFIEILDTLADKNLNSIYETRLDAIATMSCKAAVKGNNRLSCSEAEALIKKMLKLENPFSCPHGRPTIIEMSKYELEKKFKRIQN